jgi:hypothetical protein
MHPDSGKCRHYYFYVLNAELCPLYLRGTNLDAVPPSVLHRAGMLTASFKHLGDDRFLADVPLWQCARSRARFRWQRCRPLAQHRGKLRVIEDALMRVEEACHPSGVAHRGKHPVITIRS